MFGQRERLKERIEAIAGRFREKGATSPERAMTTQELGLPPRFEVAMKRRLGMTGIFVEVGGRYYMSEERLRELEQRQQGAGAAYGGKHGVWGNMLVLRIVRIVLGVSILSLALVNLLLGRSTPLWIVIVGLIASWICVSVFQIYYLARARRQIGLGQPPGLSNRQFSLAPGIPNR